jgi:glucosamine--fructose-6-phosphate aminotransferase (isomerizing)
LKRNLNEVRARADTHIESGPGIHVIRMPENYGQLTPILHGVPLQLLAYHTACARGTDVPRCQVSQQLLASEQFDVRIEPS